MKSISAVLVQAVLVAVLALSAGRAEASAVEKQTNRSTDVASHAASASKKIQRDASAPLAISTVDSKTADTETAGEESGTPEPCHWWQFRRCEKPRADTLPPDAPKDGPVITVDVSTHTAYLFQGGELVAKSPAATGSEKLLKKGMRVWLFHTPEGHLRVLRKIVDPVWTKPDWAFIENGDRVPPPDSPKRQVRGHLGRYALDLGDGILIHGTDDPSSIGKPVSHGCIRLPEEMLETVYKAAKVGTDVYIFESDVPQQTSGPEHHSDLDYH